MPAPCQASGRGSHDGTQAGKHPSKIAITSIADDRHDHRVFQAERKPVRNMHRATRGNPRKDPSSRARRRVISSASAADILDPIYPWGLVDARQIGLGPLADARNLRALLGLAPNDAHLGIATFQVSGNPHDGPGRTHAADEMRDAAPVCSQISGPVPSK